MTKEGGDGADTGNLDEQSTPVETEKPAEPLHVQENAEKSAFLPPAGFSPPAGLRPSSAGLSQYELPSRRLSLLVEGADYLKYREVSERVLFAEKLTSAQKDARIMELALSCLSEKMEQFSRETGELFVKAESLASPDF